jgi:hypothetical protein
MKKIELTPMELESRDAGSIIDAENEFRQKIWYSRCHLDMREELKNGELKLVKQWKPEYSGKNIITKKGWKECIKAGKKVERKYGKKDLGPYSDFEWGMLNGKLSAIRWVLGDDWDQLDT